MVRRPGTNASEDDICEWMEGQSAATAHLTAGVEFVDELPRNAVSDTSLQGNRIDVLTWCKMGKLLRWKLQERVVNPTKVSLE